MSRRLLSWAWAFFLPLLASAHDDRVILARVELLDNGVVSLRVTIDTDAYQGAINPERLLADDPVLIIVEDGQPTRPRDLRKPSSAFKHPSHHDLASPLGHSDDEKIRHRTLLTTEWMWTPKNAKFSLRAPNDSPHTFLFWVVDARDPSAIPRPLRLTKGMETPVLESNAPSIFPLADLWPKKKNRTERTLVFIAFALSGCLTLWWCRRVVKKLVPW